MSALPSSRAPVKFTDPLYAQLAHMAEIRHNMPAGILDAIRTLGERSNADQVSSAGARGAYQFIAPTRRGMIKNYGVDPWKDANSETEAAALHLLESHRRTGDWDRAIAGYHGGIKAEHGHGGPQNRAYANRVGSFDGENEMGASLYPAPYYGRDPLAPLPTEVPEPVKDAVPVPGDPGPSQSMPAAAPVAAKKRGGGILGALESIFMPDADSRWAAALRGGLFDAKANQDAYKAGQYKQDIDMATATAKLKALLTKGEYQVVGNNVLHIDPQGNAAFIEPPANKGENERLIERWTNMDDGDPAKELIHQMLLGANNPEVLAAKHEQAKEIARIRAGATTGAASIRAKSAKTNTLPPLPPGDWSVVK